jgi:hypothetical protein
MSKPNMQKYSTQNRLNTAAVVNLLTVKHGSKMDGGSS